MEIILSLAVQLIGGGSGGNYAGHLIKGVSLGTNRNLITGALGGLAGVFLARKIPGLDGLVGDMFSGGSFTPAAFLGQGLTGVAGGAILTAIVGFVKNNMIKS